MTKKKRVRKRKEEIENKEEIRKKKWKGEMWKSRCRLYLWT
jgi:hypothetical protein